jgi:hypothetical protein
MVQYSPFFNISVYIIFDTLLVSFGFAHDFLSNTGLYYVWGASLHGVVEISVNAFDIVTVRRIW